MFEYFPGNYVWNLGVVATLNSGGLIDEVDRACRPIKDAAARGEDAGTPDFLRAWTALTDQLVAQAEYGREGRPPPHRRAALLPRDQLPLPGRTDAVQLRPRTGSRRTAGCSSCRRRPSTSEPAGLAAWRSRTKGRRCRPTSVRRPATDAGPAPVIVLVNGLDSTKEHMYCSGHWEELAARGISCLMLDQPGTGEALRLQGLTARIDTEAWAGAAVDWLATRDDVDPPGSASSAGRSAATTPRAPPPSRSVSPLCVAWGANHNWGAVQRRRLEREGERPVPHYWEHVLWVWGHDDLDTFIDFADDVHLDGVVEKITVPFLIAHGENDRQIPLEYAHRSYEQAVNTPSGSCGCSRPRRARPSTSAWTTCRTSAPSSPTGWPTPSRSSPRAGHDGRTRGRSWPPRRVRKGSRGRDLRP